MKFVPGLCTSVIITGLFFRAAELINYDDLSVDLLWLMVFPNPSRSFDFPASVN